jgi:hypothetical protein
MGACQVSQCAAAAVAGVPLASIAYTLGRSGLTGEVKSYGTVYNK